MRYVGEREGGGDDHGGQRRLGQVGEQRVEEQQEQEHQTGSHKTGQLTLGTRLLGHGGPRAAGRNRKALEEAGGHVGSAHADHLLVGLDLVTAPGGEAGGRSYGVGQ